MASFVNLKNKKMWKGMGILSFLVYLAFY